MAPDTKIAKACKAMKPFGIPDNEVKAALKELLKLYNNKWGLIEEDKYKVLLDVLLDKRRDEDKREDLKRSESSLKLKEKGVKYKKKDALLHHKFQESEPLSKRLRSRHKKEEASAAVGYSEHQFAKALLKMEEDDMVEPSSDSECEPLLKRSRLRHRTEASGSVHMSHLQPHVAKTSFRPQQDEAEGTELPLSSQTLSEPEESDTPLINLHSRNQKKQVLAFVDNPGARLANTPLRKKLLDETELSCCREQEAEPAELYFGDGQTDSKLIFPQQHLVNKGRKGNSSQNLRLGKPCSLYGRTKPNPSSISPGHERKIPEMLLVTYRKSELNSISLTDDVLDMCHSNSLDTLKVEPFTDDQALLLEDVPWTTGGSSNKNNSCMKGAGLEVHNSKSLDAEDKGLSCEEGYSNRSCHHIKENGLKFLQSKSLDLEDKTDTVSDSSMFDIASSSTGEVKVSLICNSPELFDLSPPSLDPVLKVVEDKYRILQPNFSLRRLMRELCECFSAVKTVCVDGQRVRLINMPPVLDIPDANDDYGQHFYIPPSYSNGSLQLGNFIEVVPQIPRHIALSGLDGLHHVIGFKIKNIGNICKESAKKIKLLKCLPSSNDLRLDDITKGEERVKISLLNGSADEQLPTFFYIRRSEVYDKAHVNFALAHISDRDCCSACFHDCLTSTTPCACAQETGNGFAYTPTGLVKERFLEECLSLNQDPIKRRYLYCTNCPLERSQSRHGCNSCKGHLMRKFIKECWLKCRCSKLCGNRVVQRGISRNLQVFWTPEGKGWGLRTAESLPRGAFVCEYVGEILTYPELCRRYMQCTSYERHASSVLLDANWGGSENILRDEEALCLDATVYGNIARFINHRCSDATLIDIPVEVETPNRCYYHLAFFTTREVAAMEELTWDYGIDFNDQNHHSKSFKCLCGSPFCRDPNH